MTIKERIEAANQKEYITAEEVALLLGIHEITVYRNVKRQTVPGVMRFGRSIRFKRVVTLRNWPGRTNPVDNPAT